MNNLGKIILFILILALMGVIVLGYFGNSPREKQNPVQEEQGQVELSSLPKQIPVEPNEATPVNTDAIEEETLEEDPQQEPGDVYTIQIASFQELTRAQLLAKSLNEDGHYAAYVPDEDLKEGDRWHRVYVGKYETKEEAKAKLLLLKEKFSDSFIRLLIKGEDSSL
jgi:cell division septation protein DedD